MPQQANIVSFDEARRAAVARRSSGSSRVIRSSDGSGVRTHAGRFADDPDFAMPDIRTPEPFESPFRTSRIGKPAPLSRDEAHRGPHSLESRGGAANEEFFEEGDEELEAPLGPVGRLTLMLGKKRRRRAKEKAGRAYVRQYETMRSTEANQAGPRAAVYKGEMGSTHRKSARMQQRSSASSSYGGYSPSFAKPSILSHTPLVVCAAALICVVAGVLFLYGPSQQLYTDIRERDRLAAEYAAVTERNDLIEAQVNALSTDAGVEDAARTELGWVKEGEHAVSVSGLQNYEPENNFRGNIVSDDIPFPETWYSGFLDPIFGVE